MIWKKFTFASIIIIGWLSLTSCMWGPWDDVARIQMFEGSVGVSKNLYPFFFAYSHLNRNFYPANMTPYNIPDENIDEWMSYIEGNYTKDEITEIIYKSPINQILKIRNNKVDFDNDFAKSLINNKDVINYIYFAKKVEKELNPPEDFNWYYDDFEFNIKYLLKLAKIAERQADIYTDTMLKQRYAYQAIVLFRYASEFQKAINDYDKFFKNIPQNQESILKYWALSHIATCESYLDNFNQSQQIFLDVFYNSDAKKRWAYQNLDVDYLESVKNELSPTQYYSYLAIKELQNPGKILPQLKTIAILDQNNQLFKLLMNREVNKIENWLLTKKYSSVEPEMKDKLSNYKKDIEYTKKFILFTEEILSKADSNSIAQMELILAHLNFIIDDAEKANFYLQKSKNHIKTDDEITQYHIENILIQTISIDSYNNDFAQKIFDELVSLNYENIEKMKKSKVLQSLIQAEFSIFHEKGQYEIAAMFLAYSQQPDVYLYDTWWDFSSAFLYLDKYASTEQIKKFISISESKNKNSLESFLLDSANYNKYRFTDLLGTKELRKGNLEEALSYYNQIPKEFWTGYEAEGCFSESYSYYLNRNPFENKLLPLDERGEITDNRYIDKSFFVEALIEKKLLFNQAKDEEKGKIALELANAYYNMSYFGQNWYYDCYGKSCYGGRLLSTSFNTEVNDNYKTCSTAFEYYDIAIDLLKDENLKAKAYFCAASAYSQVIHFDFPNDNGDYYGDSYWNNDTNENITNHYSISFRQFSEDLYDRYLSECKF